MAISLLTVIIPQQEKTENAYFTKNFVVAEASVEALSGKNVLEAKTNAALAANEMIKSSVTASAPKKTSSTPQIKDRDVLERIVEAEARGESYEGKIAVANVVLNRVNSGEFPSTVKGVVFQSGQFTPAMNGSIWNVSVSSETKRAVDEALTGTQAVSSKALFFLNPKIASSNWISRSRTKERTIGNHAFYK
jgi:N-acetylmuramoyl-L-alanine amidase